MKYSLHPEEYEVLANICDLYRFREYCTEEYNHLRLMDYSEEKAFERITVMAHKLNSYNSNVKE